MSTLEEVDSQILSTCNEVEVEAESTTANEYETKVYVCVAEIEGALGKLHIRGDPVSPKVDDNAAMQRSPFSASEYSHSRVSSPTHSQYSSSSHGLPQGGDYRPRRNHVRRPKLEMEHFDGNLLDYPSFIDSFKSSVDSDPDLSDTDKFAYLKGLLKGRALNTIKGLSIFESNYFGATREKVW